MDHPYILFHAGMLRFFISMEHIDVIGQTGQQSGQRVPVFNFCRICRLQELKQSDRYTLILKAGGERFGITAELVEDMMYIQEEDILALKALVINEKNQYLAGIMPMKDEKPIYILDIMRLYEKISVLEPDCWF